MSESLYTLKFFERSTMLVVFQCIRHIQVPDIDWNNKTLLMTCHEAVLLAVDYTNYYNLRMVVINHA